MATTTTHYGFDIPQSTDLVKDGATAIATLGQDIDTAMNTALGTNKAGLVLLNTTSFSGVSSQSVSSIFNANYSNYQIQIEHTGTSSVAFIMRLRSGSTDNTSTNYNSVGFYHTAGAGTPTGQTYQSQTYWWIGDVTNGAQGYSVIDLFRPFETATTGFTCNALYNASATTAGHQRQGGGITVTTSYDGFTFAPGTGNITGTVRVYGYNK